MRCGNRSPLNYDQTRWATCELLAGHDGEHRYFDLQWTDRTMPYRVVDPADRDRLRATVERQIAEFDDTVPIRELREQVERLERERVELEGLIADLGKQVERCQDALEYIRDPENWSPFHRNHLDSLDKRRRANDALTREGSHVA